MKEYSYIVEKEEENTRIDKLTAVKLSRFTRSQIQRISEKQMLFANGSPANKNYRVVKDDKILLVASSSKNVIISENLSFELLYEDEYLAVINKPQGMLVYPSPQEKAGTLANGLVYLYGDRLSKYGGEHRPGIVHRLDKGTSGALIIAFDDETHKQLAIDFQNQKIVRKYRAVAYGEIDETEFEILAPIGRDPIRRIQMAVLEDGRSSYTTGKVVAYYEGYSLVELQLHTGRTHQLRVHMDYFGHPIVGDPVYGVRQNSYKFMGQCLHASLLEFVHPITKEEIHIQSPMPEYMNAFINTIN